MTMTNPETLTEVPAPEAPRPRGRLLVVLLLLLVASAAVALAVLQSVRLHDARSTASDERAALVVARQVASDLNSYDYTTLDADFGKVLASATDPIKSQYTTTSAKLKALLVQYKAKATSTVTAGGVASHTGSTVTVVLFVDQTVTNTNTPQSRVDRNRLQLTLRKVDGRWLVSDAQLL